MFCSQCCKTRRKRLEHARSVVGNARLSRGFLQSTWVRLEKFANNQKDKKLAGISIHNGAKKNSTNKYQLSVLSKETDPQLYFSKKRAKAEWKAWVAQGRILFVQLRFVLTLEIFLRHGSHLSENSFFKRKFVLSVETFLIQFLRTDFRKINRWTKKVRNERAYEALTVYCSQCCRACRKRLEHARSVVGNARLSRGFLQSTWVRLEKFANNQKDKKLAGISIHNGAKKNSTNKYQLSVLSKETDPQLYFSKKRAKAEWKAWVAQGRILFVQLRFVLTLEIFLRHGSHLSENSFFKRKFVLSVETFLIQFLRTDFRKIKQWTKNVTNERAYLYKIAQRTQKSIR